jgi:hypothetical protein
MAARQQRALLALIAFPLLLPSICMASGHGPVFGLATPTNARGGWSLDLGMMGRTGEQDAGAMVRAMLSYGITADLQASFSFPAVLNSAPLAPARMTSMMPGTGDFEGVMAWRFHRQGTSIGSRLESTVYGGLIVPGPQEPAGMLGELSRAPGLYTAFASGYASRSHYLWAGAGYTRFAQAQGDRRPQMLTYSLVWGYRPGPLRKEYPHWDWRFFMEMTGEKFGKIRRDGVAMAGSNGHQIFLGPSALGIYKNYAVEAGIQLPIYRNVGPFQQREKFRYAINLSYFF